MENEAPVDSLVQQIKMNKKAIWKSEANEKWAILFELIKVRIWIVEEESPVFQLNCKFNGASIYRSHSFSIEVTIVYITENHFPYSKFDAWWEKDKNQVKRFLFSDK